MNEMVERVALAIAKAQWGSENTKNAAWRELPDIFEATRAAIAAMRDPTEAMLKSFRVSNLASWVEEAERKEIWQAMVDEALK